MGSQIVIGCVIYCLLVAGMWFGESLDGNFGSIIFWVFFVLSTFIAYRIIEFIREFFIITFARCNDIPQEYIDEEMRKYRESIEDNE